MCNGVMVVGRSPAGTAWVEAVPAGMVTRGPNMSSQVEAAGSEVS